MLSDETFKNGLTATRARIIADFGDINDLPYKLANTLVNVCARMCIALFATEDTKYGSYEQLEYEYSSIRKSIIAYREIRSGPEKNHSLLKISETILRAVYSHCAKNSDNKSPLQFALDCKIRKNRDIPDLAMHLKLHNG